MKKLKFLMTTTFYPPYHVGGDANHVKYLADELTRQGHEVHVMFSVDAYQIKRGKVSKPDIELGQVQLHPLRSPRGRLEPLLVYLRGKSGYFLKEFDRLVKEISPDVVHHHNISLLGYDFLKKRGSYLNVYTAHDYWLICQRYDLLKNGQNICHDNRSCVLCALRHHRPPQLWRRGGTLKRALRDVDLVIAPSAHVSSVISGAAQVPVVTMHNFIPHPREDVPPARFRDYLLYLGRLEKAKGIVELLDVFRNRDSDMSPKLIVAGAGPLEKPVRSYVRRHRLGNVVKVLGWCDEDRVHSLLSHANALVVPSIWPEPFGLVTIEALSRGIPVVASNMGGLPEIAALQGDGFVYTPGQLAEALARAPYASCSREELKRIYLEHFTPEKFTARYLELVCQRIKNA